MVETFQI